jgi:hypothetical protein
MVRSHLAITIEDPGCAVGNLSHLSSVPLHTRSAAAEMAALVEQAEGTTVGGPDRRTTVSNALPPGHPGVPHDPRQVHERPTEDRGS